ncbi:SusC/RagA family TonB-linked outer membrane protein [Neptunitalea chrysea]|uniref:SusC/RagA family TonB-linked outer membrane protein n=1 Tax=Neptunitalea chrysea TaxID=1647581 RepID=A0A9W6EVD7_9FLAO|nr:TonB-dependent receptor [Neptunitalea chrysea]GLB52791.1 SusC/RagA family TonB-linked outer membrane protein [Neptunitalea chrysea]
MKSKLFLLIFGFISYIGFSQEYDIKGVVYEASTGMPMPGVNVVLKDNSKGTSTDFDGNFMLEGISKGSELVISYIGFKSQTIVVINGNALTIKLEEDTNALDEVVVIGYGKQKKKEVTGAVGTVEADLLDEFKPVKVEQALQGTVAGVNVTTQSGSPGAALDIRIRGVATNGNNAPLVIIDGYVGELGLLNPNDIETITVLKDAQAAIYGSVGANGVILVTTKRGRKNMKPSVSYNTYYGFQETSKKMSLLNATEYALLLNESYVNGGGAAPYPSISGLGEGTDWQDEVFESAPILNHDVNLMGGTETVTYAISASHLDQEGIVGKDKSGFLRNTARLALNVDITKKLKASTNVIYTYFTRKTLNENGLGSVLFNAINTPPTLSTHDNDGNYTLVPSTTGLGTEVINPLAQIANTFNDYNYKKTSGNFGLDFTPIEGLTLTGRVGFNTSNSESKSFSPEISYGGKVFDNTRSSVNQGAVNDNNYTFDFFANYEKTIADDHNINVTLGNTIFKEWGNGLYATGYDIPNNSWAYADISLATGVSEAQTNSSYVYDERRLSYFGRLQYNYKGKYLFSAVLRRDASTRFGPENSEAYFPSFTGGWIISDEKFFGESSIVDFVKLRASYGKLGNDQIGSNLYAGLLGGEATYIFDGSLVNGTAISTLANPDVKWETSEKMDFGLDIRMFNNKLSFVTDYFIDNRKDLLISGMPISGIVGIGAPGAGAPTVNAGNVENKGFEFAIDYKGEISKDFTYSLAYNATFLDNNVTEVNNSTGYVEGGSFGVSQPAPSRMEVGKPIGYFLGYVTDGIFQNQNEVDNHPDQSALGATAQPGDLRFRDINNDGVIDENDRTNLGNPIPEVTMGMNIRLNYKNFDFSVYGFASVGNDMVRNYERTLSDVNKLNYVLDRWTGEGTSNTVPRVTTAATSNTVLSDYYVEDASYLRIQNMQLGYSLTDFKGFEKIRLYVAATNLFTFTKYRGYDPGASTGNPIGGGIDYGFYPVPRTYMLGLNVKL